MNKNKNIPNEFKKYKFMRTMRLSFIFFKLKNAQYWKYNKHNLLWFMSHYSMWHHVIYKNLEFKTLYVYWKWIFYLHCICQWNFFGSCTILCYFPLCYIIYKKCGQMNAWSLLLHRRHILDVWCILYHNFVIMLETLFKHQFRCKNICALMYQ